MIDLKNVFVINTEEEGLDLRCNENDGNLYSKIKDKLRSTHGINGYLSYEGITYPALSLIRVLSQNKYTSLLIYAPANYNGYEDLEIQLIDNSILKSRIVSNNIIYLNKLYSEETLKVFKYVQDDDFYSVENRSAFSQGEKMSEIRNGGAYYGNSDYTPVNILFLNDELAIV